MTTEPDFPISLAGRTITDPVDRLRRYCGLPWSGGPPETWAWQYYDLVPTGLNDLVEPIDVLAAGALHPGLTRAELAFFAERGEELTQWLAALPADRSGDGTAEDLRSATDDTLDQVGSLTQWAEAVSLPLLTKVLHRKRPHLIPLLDRHIIDNYRPIVGRRRATEAWRPLLDAMRADLDPETSLLLSIASGAATGGGDVQPNLLRSLDIVIWMGAQR